MIRLNVFSSAYDKVPTEYDLEWAEVCELLGDMITSEALDKRKLPAFSCALLREPYNTNENVVSLGALPIDVDQCDGAAVIEKIEGFGFAALVYASPSDPNPDGSRRLRVLVPLTEPLDPAHVEHARFALAELLGIGPGQGVETAKASSQIMFTGKIKGTPDRDFATFGGMPVSTTALTGAKLKDTWSNRKTAAKVKALERLGIEDPDDRTIALLESLAEHWEEPGEATQRRQVLRALGGYLARRGWTDEQIAAVGRGLETERPEADRLALMVECARDTRASDGDVGAGWSGLVEWSPKAAASIESVAKDPLEPTGFVGIWDAWWRAQYARPGSWVNRARERRESPDPLATAGTAGTETKPGTDYDWASEDAPIDWYCKALGIAPSERKVTIIAGDPGSGKGPLANYLAVCFAFGLKAFGSFDCKQCNVGILDYEGARLSARRIRSQARGLGIGCADLTGRIFLHDTDPGELGFLGAWIEEHSIEVLIVDSYMSAMSTTDADPNSPEYAQLARDFGSLGIVVIVIAHARKPPAGKRGERPALGDVAGSYALGGMAATAIAVWNPDDDDRLLTRLGCMRAPEEPFKTFDIRWSKSGTEAAPVWRCEIDGLATREARDDAKAVTVEQARDQKLTRVAAHVIACMAQNISFPRTVTAVARDTGLHHRDVGAVMSALARAGMAHAQASIKGGSAFVLADGVDGITIEAGEVSKGGATAPPKKRFGRFGV